MSDKRCFRCSGRKKIYKTNGGYSSTDTGGVEVTCPLCNGDGVINVPSLEEIEKLEAKLEEKKEPEKKKTKQTAKKEEVKED